jgi:hypothetical protein
MGAIGRTALLAMAVSTLLGASGEDAHASTLDDAAGDGAFVTAQEGDQNFDCGNTRDLINVNVLHTTRRETCSGYGATGFTGNGTSAVGGTALGPQFTTAQSGEQNLHCGNSADMLTLNALGTIEERTTCDTEQGPGRSDGRWRGPGPGRGDGSGPASAVGGTALGPQFTTAQSGEQNLHCGNSADMLTLNALGTIDKRTTCTAVDHSGELASHDGFHRGKATAESGTAVGPQSATAQTGSQNLYCGADEDLVSVPVLGETRKDAICAAAKGY